MAKTNISVSKITPVKQVNPIVVNINEQEVEIIQYLPV
jgi:hypothetical protein